MHHLPYIGTAILLCGIFCLIAKALSPEYLDAQGYLHENFFLLPISFALLLAAVLLFLGAGIHFLKNTPFNLKRGVFLIFVHKLRIRNPNQPATTPLSIYKIIHCF